MNPNSPNCEESWEGETFPTLINIQPTLGVGMVKTSTGKKFPVHIPEHLIGSVQLLDFVEIAKSKVTGEWIVTDYYINDDVYIGIEDTYMTPEEGGVLHE